MFAAVKCMSYNARHKDDALNSALGGMAAGLVVGVRGRMITAVVGGLAAGAIAGLAGQKVVPSDQPALAFLKLSREARGGESGTH